MCFGFVPFIFGNSIRWADLCLTIVVKDSKPATYYTTAVTICYSLQYICPKTNCLLKRTKQMIFPFDVRFECARQTNSFFSLFLLLLFSIFFHFHFGCSESLVLFDAKRPLVVWSPLRFLIAISRSFIVRLLLVIMTMCCNSRQKDGPNRNVEGDNSRQKSHHFHLNEIIISSINCSLLSSERIDKCRLTFREYQISNDEWKRKFSNKY